MTSFSYLYELRRGTSLVATGRLTRDEEVQVGDRMSVGSHTGLVRTIQPGLSGQPPRILIELLPS
jgi:hypothetical protein